MSKFIFGTIAVILIIATALFIYPKQKQNISNQTISTNSPTIQSINNNQLGAGGSSYLDTQGVYNFLYPNDYTLDTQDPQHTRIFKRAETERPQSEISDGVLIVFVTINLKENTLEDWLSKHLKEVTSDGTNELVEKEKVITINNYPGYEYTLKGFGTSQNIVLQKDKSSKYALKITYTISDPKDRGYLEDVNQILSSLNILK